MTTESETDEFRRDRGSSARARARASGRPRPCRNWACKLVRPSGPGNQGARICRTSLFVALRDLRRLPSHGAQVRQRQYIGKLMRNIDPEPVLAKLAERKQRHDSGDPAFPADRALARPAAVRARPRAVAELLRGISARGPRGTRRSCWKRPSASGWNSAPRRARGSFSHFCGSCSDRLC